jgi:hypothetical protein
VAGPESGGSAALADFSKEEALMALGREAVGKILYEFLDRALDKTPNDVIVEFVNTLPLTSPLEEKKVSYAATKSRVAAAVPSGYEVIRDYDALPMSFIRLKSRRALVNFLNNAEVKAVFEDEVGTVAQSSGR